MPDGREHLQALGRQPECYTVTHAKGVTAAGCVPSQLETESVVIQMVADACAVPIVSPKYCAHTDALTSAGIMSAATWCAAGLMIHAEQRQHQSSACT